MTPSSRFAPLPAAASLAPASWGKRLFRKIGLGLLTAVLWVSCLAAEAIKVSFDLPEDSIETSLKRFSNQSGLEVIFPTDAVTGIRTRSVRGEMTSRQALDGMLVGTGFRAFQDEKTGAITVRKSGPKKNNGPDRGAANPGESTPIPKVENQTSHTPPMKKTSLVARLGAIIGLSVGATADAQVVAPEDSAKKVASEPAVVLSPFEVTAAEDTGYAASSALTGSRTNEKLADMPNAISVITSDLMKDFAISDFFGAVNYGVNTENITNATDVTGAPVGASASNQVLIRGIPSLRQLRNGFPWFLPIDSFNIDRVEFNRGPSGQVYGDVDPIGVVNVSTKQPRAKFSAEALARYDNFGTRRFTFDLNEPVSDRLQMRFNAVNSDIEKSRQRADTNQRSYAAALRWYPFKKKTTTINVNFEEGHYRLNLAAEQINDGTAAYVRGTGTTALDANPNSPGVQTNGVGMAQIRVASGNVHIFEDIGGTLYDMKSTATNVFRNSTVLTTAGVDTGPDPQNPKSVPLQTVTNSIIPYGQDWGGPDNHSDSRYRTVSLEVTQKVGNHLNLLLAGNSQWQDSSQESMFSGSSVFGINSRALFIDVNPVIPNPNVPGGTIPNPRFEQYFVGYIPVYITSGNKVSGLRGSAVYDLPIPYKNSSLRFVGGANFRDEKFYNNRWGYSLTREEMARRGLSTAASTYPNNIVYPIHYLSDGNSDQALKLKSVPGVEDWYRNSPANNSRYHESLGALSLNTLGSFINGRIHVSAGVDREYFRETASLPAVADALGVTRFLDDHGNMISNDGNYDVPYVPFVKAYTTNVSYGGVVQVLPWMSLGAGSFESSLFSESNSSNLAGKPALPHTGSGQDYSLRFNLLNDRVFATLGYFNNVAKNNVLSLSAAAETELNALLPANDKLVGTGDYRDQTTKGWEFELQSNLTAQWTLRGAYAVNWTTYTRFYPLVRPYLAEARANAAAQGLNPAAATAVTQALIDATEGANGNLRRETANIETRYSFTREKLKGLSVGLSARYVLGHPLPAVVVGSTTVYPATSTGNYVLLNPMLVYRHRFWGRTVKIQENINNVLDRRSQQWLAQHNFSIFTEPRQFITTISIDL